LGNRLYPIQNVARWLDCQLVGRALGGPYVLLGQEDQPLSKEEFIQRFLPWTKNLDGKEIRWVAVSVISFLRDYCRTLSLAFPSMKCKLSNLTVPSEDLSSLIKTLKSFCLSPISKLLDQGGATWHLPFSGSPRRYLKRILGQRITTKKLLFVNSVLQLKRVCAKVPESFITESLLTHRGRILQDRRQPLWFIDLVSRYAGFLTAGFHWNIRPHTEVNDYSLSSCVESPRSQGGNYGYFEIRNEDGFMRPVVRKVKRDHDVVNIMHSRMSIRAIELESLIPMKPHREAHAIPEPLKVRVITSHHAAESPLWSSFQKEMTKYLSRNKRFLFGKEVSVSDFILIPEKLDQMERYYQEPCLIISDDADAATDSFDPLLTQVISLDMVPEWLIPCWLRTLRGEIHYPKLGDEFTTSQRTSQLMGDRRSFVLLNIVHYAAKMAFLAEHGVPKYLRTFFVNGDDGVILLPQSLIEPYFSFMTNLWGMNRLKTYIHSDIFSFNSTLFTCQRGVVRRLPIIRWSLIAGTDKYGNYGKNPTVWNYIRDEILDWFPSFEEPLLGYFISSKHWRKTLQYLDKRGNGNNWFLPKSVGGYGLRNSKNVRLTPRQQAGVDLVMRSIGKESNLSIRTREVRIKEKKNKDFIRPFSSIRFHNKYVSFHKTKQRSLDTCTKVPCIGTKLLVGSLPNFFVTPREFPQQLWDLKETSNTIPWLVSLCDPSF